MQRIKTIQGQTQVCSLVFSCTATAAQSYTAGWVLEQAGFLAEDSVSSQVISQCPERQQGVVALKSNSGIPRCQ